MASAPPQDEDFNKDIRLGSLFGPQYIESYAESWKALLPNARKVALPILYLQRHTFELLVKELLIGALATRSALYALDELFGTVTRAGPTERDDLEKAHSTHSFSDLFPRLERNLVALGRPRLPTEFGQARVLLTDVDEDRPDRLRYETVFIRKTRTTQRSFPTGFGGVPKKIAPCHKVGSLLEDILLARSESLSAFVNDTAAPATELVEFYTAVWEYHRESEADVLSRLSPITEATRDGSVKWEEFSSASLKISEHQDLKTVASHVADVCLQTTFLDRLLTIVILKDARGEISWRDSEFFLAARRPNGTLTAGIWIGECQSNLVYEIQEAFSRPIANGPSE